jgi:hypothetical protein
MALQGIAVHATGESDPLAAVALVAAGQALPEAPPHDHDHGHDHRDAREPRPTLVQVREPQS